MEFRKFNVGLNSVHLKLTF